MLRARGARPLALSAWISAASASQTSAKRSPPGLTIIGSTTQSTAAAAIAASAA